MAVRLSFLPAGVALRLRPLGQEERLAEVRSKRIKETEAKEAIWRAKEAMIKVGTSLPPAHRPPSPAALHFDGLRERGIDANARPTRMPAPPGAEARETLRRRTRAFSSCLEVYDMLVSLLALTRPLPWFRPQGRQ